MTTACEPSQGCVVCCSDQSADGLYIGVREGWGAHGRLTCLRQRAALLRLAWPDAAPLVCPGRDLQISAEKLEQGQVLLTDYLDAVTVSQLMELAEAEAVKGAKDTSAVDSSTTLSTTIMKKHAVRPGGRQHVNVRYSRSGGGSLCTRRFPCSLPVGAPPAGRAALCVIACVCVIA